MVRFIGTRCIFQVVRPVVILEINDGIPLFASFVTLTHSKIKDLDGRYDRWKVPLFKGNDVGPGNSLYAKANCIAEAEASSFHPKNFKGNLHWMDLKKCED